MQQSSISSAVTCPLCGIQANYTTHRLIKEYCGHSKCRECLVVELNGCSLCEREKRLKTVIGSESNKINIKSTTNSDNVQDDLLHINEEKFIKSNDESNSDKLEIDTNSEDSQDEAGNEKLPLHHVSIKISMDIIYLLFLIL